MAEWQYGDGAAYDCVAHVTFGTGIGAGIVERGRLLRGESEQAGEVGLVPVAPDGRGSSGVDDAWEADCSGRGIAGFARDRLAEGDAESILADENPADLTAADVFRAAETGDPFATDLLEEVARYNARGIGALANVANPGLVTVGGDVARNHREWLLDGIERHLDRYCFVDPPDLRFTSLGEEIDCYGALAAYRAAETD